MEAMVSSVGLCLRTHQIIHTRDFPEDSSEHKRNLASLVGQSLLIEPAVYIIQNPSKMLL